MLELDFATCRRRARVFFVRMLACWSPKLISEGEIQFARVAAVRPAVYVSPSAHAMCRAPCLRGCLLRCRRRCVLRRADAVGGVLSDGLEAVGSLRSPFTLGPTEAPNLTVLELYGYSHLDEPPGAIGSHQGPTGAAPMAPDVPRRPTDGSDGFPGGGKGLSLRKCSHYQILLPPQWYNKAGDTTLYVCV